MSYDIQLNEPVLMEDDPYEPGKKQPVVCRFSFKHDIRGGTYRMGGNDEAHLNITYNYAKFYYRHLDKELGIRWLYGKTAATTIERIEAAIKAILAERDTYVCDPKDKEPHPLGGTPIAGTYWEPSPDNAAAALSGLLAFAHMRPDGVWDGD